jgi:hypothetical protein
VNEDDVEALVFAAHEGLKGMSDIAACHHYKRKKWQKS